MAKQYQTKNSGKRIEYPSGMRRDVQDGKPAFQMINQHYKVIDWQVVGNVVELIFGPEHLEEWWGDDWDDAPYEHNAGEVYDEFVVGRVEIAFPWSYDIREPCDGYSNSPYSKEQLRDEDIPIVIIYPCSLTERYGYRPHDVLARVYMGQPIAEAVWELLAAGGHVINITFTLKEEEQCNTNG